MNTRDGTAVCDERILASLMHQDSSGLNQFLENVPYYLAGSILKRNSFETIEAFRTFCEKPDNLRHWLPSEADRAVFSDELVRRLGNISSENAEHTDKQPEAPLHPSEPPCEARRPVEVV